MLAATLAWSTVARVGHNDELRRMMMTLNCLGWSVIASSMLAATFAPAAYAEDIVGNNHNGLSSKAFRRNALTTNKKALEKLLRHPLNDEVFRLDDGYIGRQLRDPKAMAMIKELVECALDSKTEVTARDRAGKELGQWRGEMGLCQIWHTDSLNKSEECQEVITACVMARVNALGKSIPLSLRSEPSFLSPLRDKVPIETRFRESPPREDPSEGWPIPSFSTECRGLDCNWSPAYVGTCAPGDEIQLAIDDPSDRSTCDAMGLRVCAGIYGCSGPTVDELPNGSPLPSYSKHLGDKLGVCRKSPLKFICPSVEATAGFYSVMTRPHRLRTRQEPSRTSTVVKVKGSGKYPAPEKDVFRFPEGAFYGNMFKPGMLTLSCTVDDATTRTMPCEIANPSTVALKSSNASTAEITLGAKICNIDLESGDPVGDCPVDLVTVPYRDVYACYTYAQQVDADSGVAALNARLCDSPDASNCFAYRPQRCHYANAGTAPQRDSLCEPIGNDGAFGHCKSQVEDTSRFRGIITTYLFAPCDFLGEGKLCDAMLRSTPPILPKVRPQHGCAGCSLHGAGGGLQPTSLAAALAVVLLRRRRRHPDGSGARTPRGLRAATPADLPPGASRGAGASPRARAALRRPATTPG